MKLGKVLLISSAGIVSFLFINSIYTSLVIANLKNEMAAGRYYPHLQYTPLDGFSQWINGLSNGWIHEQFRPLTDSLAK